MRSRRILSILLCLCLVFALAVPAYAADEAADEGWVETAYYYTFGVLFDYLQWFCEDVNALGDAMWDGMQQDFIDSFVFWKELYDALAYDDYVSTLPTGLQSTSGGSFKYGTGFTMEQSDSSDFWSTINLQEKALNASPGQFMLLGGYGNRSVSSYYGLLLSEDTCGARYLSYTLLNEKSVLPYTAADLPLGEFLDISSVSLAYSDLDSFGSNRFPAFLTYDDYRLAARSGRLPEYSQYLTSSSYCHYVTYGRSSTGGSRAALYVSDVYYSTETGGSVEFLSSDAVCGYWTKTYDTYAAIPAVYDCSSDYGPETRPVTMTQTINNYNTDNSVTDNSTNVNYYIAPQTYVTNLEDNSIDINYCYSPTVYDEKTLVFTEPVTGAQYQSTGWTYDYTSRCYDIALDAGTFTISDTDVTQILCTYGDEAVTIDYYDASGNALQSDVYSYVMVSGSECSLTGHTYNVETTKEASCTSAGERLYTCSVCGDQYVEDIPKSEHSFADYTVQKEPTCTNKGLSVSTCLTCGSEVNELLDPLGHDWLPTSITDESWAMPDGINCPDCHGTSFTYTRSDYEIEYGKNLYQIVDGFTSGSGCGSVVSSFDPSTMEYTLNGTVTMRGDIFLGRIDPEWIMGKNYTVTVFKTGGTVELAGSSVNTFAFSLFTRDSANYVRGSLTLPKVPDKYIFTCPAIASSGGDGFLVFLQCWDVGTVFTDFKFKIQIEEGSVSTEYEPCTPTEVEIIPPIYHFTCDDCSNTWDAEAVYKHAYTTFTCSRCGETMVQSEDPDSGLFGSLGNFLANGINWITEKLSLLIDTLGTITDTYNEYLDTVIQSTGDFPTLLGEAIALMPPDFMAVVWFSVIALVMLAVWMKWFH